MKFPFRIALQVGGAAIAANVLASASFALVFVLGFGLTISILAGQTLYVISYLVNGIYLHCRDQRSRVNAMCIFATLLVVFFQSSSIALLFLGPRYPTNSELLISASTGLSLCISQAWNISRAIR